MTQRQVKPFYISLKPFLDHNSLPRPVNWPSVFGNDHPLEVEIGFGNGEYLAKLAEANPNINYVGFEEYCERISRTLRKLSRVPGGSAGSGSNVRVLRLDVRPAFNYLFDGPSINFIHCLFPPPWPKKSDAKHRLMTTAFLRLANSRLRERGGMNIVTDHKPHAAWIREQVPGSGFVLHETIVPACYGTKFERKWAEGGQKEFYELRLTKAQHIDVPHKEGLPLKHFTIDRFDPDGFVMPDFSDGEVAVVYKDLLYDPKRQIALVHVLVHDEHLLQNVRVAIVKKQDTWSVHLAQGSMLMPTPGIAKAIECVKAAAANSGTHT